MFLKSTEVRFTDKKELITNMKFLEVIITNLIPNFYTLKIDLDQ